MVVINVSDVVEPVDVKQENRNVMKIIIVNYRYFVSGGPGHCHIPRLGANDLWYWPFGGLRSWASGDRKCSHGFSPNTTLGRPRSINMQGGTNDSTWSKDCQAASFPAHIS